MARARLRVWYPERRKPEGETLVKKNLGDAYLVEGPQAKGHFVKGAWQILYFRKRNSLGGGNLGEGKPW